MRNGKVRECAKDMHKGHAQRTCAKDMPRQGRATSEVETEGGGGSGRLSTKNMGLVLVGRGGRRSLVQASAGK
jgi:hypothetical protein